MSTFVFFFSVLVGSAVSKFLRKKTVCSPLKAKHANLHLGTKQNKTKLKTVHAITFSVSACYQGVKSSNPAVSSAAINDI